MKKMTKWYTKKHSQAVLFILFIGQRQMDILISAGDPRDIFSSAYVVKLSVALPNSG